MLKYQTKKENISYTSNYNKFTSDIHDAKIIQKQLVNKSDVSNLVRDSD